MDTTTTDLFQFFDSQTYDVKNMWLEYKKPIFENVFFNNKYILLQNAKYILFNVDKWKMRPHEFCQDYYSEQYLYPIILTVNDINSIFDFLPENFYNNFIIAPKIDVIYSVLSLST
jgi:hypothetical protein